MRKRTSVSQKALNYAFGEIEEAVMLGTPPRGWSTTRFAKELQGVVEVRNRFTPDSDMIFYNPNQVQTKKFKKVESTIAAMTYAEVIDILEA